MIPLEHIVTAVGGVATRQQLLAHGASGYDITAAVREGRVIRIRQARYVTAATRFEVRIAARVGGMLAGPSAAGSYDLWGGFGLTIHLAVADNASRLRVATPSFTHSDRPRARIKVHWSPSGRVPELGPECWRVPVAEAIRQTLRWSDAETSLACLDVAMTRGLLDPEILDGEPARSRLLFSMAQPGSDSGVESVVRRRLEESGIAVEQQLVIDGVGRVDMVVAGTRLVIEVDGRSYHEGPSAFEEDRRRDAELVARGYTVVRLSYLRVATDWPWCFTVVRSAIASFRRS